MASTINASTSSGIVQTADTSGVLQLQTAGTTAVTVDASQNVGINKTPNAWGSGFKALQISDVTSLWSNPSVSTTYLSNNLYYDGSVRKYITSNYAGEYQINTSGYHAWFTAPSGSAGGTVSLTEVMRIASNGQMLLGTTTNSGRSPPLIISNDSGTTNWAVGPSSGGSTQFYVSAGAGVYLSTTAATSWTANSDINLKNITGKIENALDAISTLTPAKFTWKSDEENIPQVGLIAQEVEKVLPEVVDKNADGYLGVRYTETIPLLVAAIQEQQTIINDLKARIETLEGAK